ncbi:WD repeat containing protein pop1 [Cordyceps fumosorosea ARSEF 2679]|uniref:WD repeat containing protein pop1 n=1 Tax=Cordyceps fumosorosea (strain ARSEF 2679) TaxID=1081104 RepID=A0A168BYS6_CORFA|nr:WD repeat containing protein pop1 [Cordyceps fumosorosea ARSEF 2679]OAA70720.1 WD repeat containing protein pop1 [Cordyceps fumosorosea ARSEF 2679]
MRASPSPSLAGPPRHLDARRPRSAQTQTVAVNLVETPSQQGTHHFQLHVSECVETKTVTTTTRLTRKFPQVFVRDPTPLSTLDAREYPLARKPTPPELSGFSLINPGRVDDMQFLKQEDPEEAEEHEHVKHEVDDDPLMPANHIAVRKSTARGNTDSSVDVLTRRSHQFPHRLSTGRTRPTSEPQPLAPQPTNALRRSSRHSSISPSEPLARRTRQSSRPSLADSSTSVPQDTKPPTARQTRSSRSQSLSNRLRRSVAQPQPSSSGRQPGDGSRVDGSAGFLATPGTSSILGSSQSRAAKGKARQLDIVQDSRETTPTTQLQYDAGSPAGSEAHTIFSSNVATPPITDADAEPFGDTDESLQRSIRLHQRPSIDIPTAQDASLPSPRLSPTLAAGTLPRTGDAINDDEESSFDASNHSAWPATQSTDDVGSMELAPMGYRHEDSRELSRARQPFLADTQTLLEAFDSMKTEMKTFMMYQFLRRCPRATLRVIADAVNPALKCDFLRQLPLELGYHILAYLDFRDLCRAAQVSKHWRNMVDRNETGWKELFDMDGFALPPGELTKAITQGWGWQDPVGPTGHERDLSMHSRLVASSRDLVRSVKNEQLSKTRSAKRKRGISAYSVTERSKRRAFPNEAIVSRHDGEEREPKQHKSEGPISAANAAALAVPDPQLGLPSLRQLHLYKSLYRRHHMIRQSWTSGKVKPRHVAFGAHIRHVITCLQFDEDKIITGSDDTLIHIYDTRTGKLLKKLEGHEGGVWALQYEGNILVSGSTDRSVRVWDIERGLCQQVFYGHTSTVRCLQILMPAETGRTHDGKPIMQPEKPLIITGSRDSQLRVWRLPEVGSRRYIQTGPPAHESDCPYFIRVLIGHTHSVRAIAAHGDTLVSGSYDSTVRVWRISTGEAVHVLHGHAQKVYSVVLDHERNRCISGSMDSYVKIWDLDTGACLQTLEGHNMLVGLLDLRDERLVSAAADSTLRIWDPETGKCKHTLMAHTGAITCFQHDGRKVISGSEKTVKMWDIRSGEWVQDLLTDLRGVWQVKFDERRCVAAVQRGDLTYVEILDFGAVRDGVPPEELGTRKLLNETEIRAMLEEEP